MEAQRFGTPQNTNSGKETQILLFPTALGMSSELLSIEGVYLNSLLFLLHKHISVVNSISLLLALLKDLTLKMSRPFVLNSKPDNPFLSYSS